MELSNPDASIHRKFLNFKVNTAVLRAIRFAENMFSSGKSCS